jgi:Leucine-rich repeat (LRR) protein
MLFTTAPVCVYASETSVEIDQTNFPDTVFRNYVKRYDKNSDGELSSSELKAVKEIEIKKSNVRKLDGIEYFTRLTTLDCSGNRMTSLSLNKNKRLKELDCSDNKLTSLNVSKNTKLTTLDCSGNSLKSLNVSNNSKLSKLDCHDNSLTSLDVSKNLSLEKLNCSDNKLTKLDLSRNDDLKSKDLDCDKNVTVKR